MVLVFEILHHSRLAEYVGLVKTHNKGRWVGYFIGTPKTVIDLSVREAIKQPGRDTRVFPGLNQGFVIKQSRIPSLKELAIIHDFCGTKLNCDTRLTDILECCMAKVNYSLPIQGTEKIPGLCHT
jgi:hypothetical protein